MKKFLTTLLTSSILLAGCSTQTATLKPHTTQIPSYEESQSFFLFGIGQENTVNAVNICGSKEKIAKVESFHSPVNILLGAITLGIYTPRTAKVYCQ